MDYEKMVEKVKAFLGEKTEGMITERIMVEICENGDIHFRLKSGIIDGVLYWSKGSSATFVIPMDEPTNHLKVMMDVRRFLGFVDLYTLTEGGIEREECMNCETLKAEVEDLTNTIRNQELYLKKADVAEAKVAVYEEVFNGRSNIHIER